MIFNKAAIFRNIGVGILCLMGIVACEQDLEDIAVDLAGQRPFGTGDSIIEVIAYNVNIDSNRVDNNDVNRRPLYVYGINRDNDFGELKSKMITQVFLPGFGVDFGDNAIIDEVVVNIPYFSTRDGNQNAKDPITGLPIEDEEGDTLQVPNFILDSVYGNKDLEFQARVFELETFLNTLDPIDPTKRKTYYSNRDYDTGSLLFEDSFKADRNDTVIYIERRYLDGDPSTIDDIDTIKTESASPSLKFRLDKQFFKERFVDHDNPGDFANNDNFTQYFNGLYFEANGIDGPLINLSLAFSFMTIYYSNDEITDEPTGVDLNYNGITGELNVVVKTKQTMVFQLGGVGAASYQRDYGGTLLQNLLLNPDMINGESNLYVQGAGGSEAVIELFSEEALEEMRSKNWLINEANLVFYLNGEQNEIPNQMFLYKKDFNSLIDDYYNRDFGPDFFGGNLEYDSDGNPELYRFRITNYITGVLRDENPLALSKLALKNFVSTDSPDFLSLDTIVNDWNYIPKGAVLHGNKPKSNEKRIVMEIFYSDIP